MNTQIPRALTLAAVLSALLAGCGTLYQQNNQRYGYADINGTYPQNSPIIPLGNVQLSENQIYSFEKLAGIALAATAIYVVYDPLAPNWEITEAKLDDNTYALGMKMKRYHTGGAGESRVVFRRRAAMLQREKGFSGFEIVDFSEGITSETLGARYISEGVVRLTRADTQPR